MLNLIIFLVAVTILFIFSYWWGKMAKALGMDTELFGRCWESHIKKAGILDEYNQGVALGVKGTPTFYVNGVQTEATMESLSKALDAALAGAMQRL
jgi:protein-disulfide isomerase